MHIENVHYFVIVNRQIYCNFLSYDVTALYKIDSCLHLLLTYESQIHVQTHQSCLAILGLNDTPLWHHSKTYWHKTSKATLPAFFQKVYYCMLNIY